MSALAEALAALQAEMPPVPKSKRADTGKFGYTYAGLDDIAPLLYPLLGKHGLSFCARPTLNTEGAFVLHYELLHSSGELRDGQYPLPDPVHSTPQQVGSAITYARRYTVSAVTGLVSDEDDDAQASSKPKAAPREPGTTRTMRRAQPPDPQVEPPTEDGITEAQMRKLQVLLKEKGFSTRELALAFVGDALGREVASSKELTKQEASQVIDALSKEPDQ